MNDNDLYGLDTLNVGESGLVCQLPDDTDKRHRLMSLGLINGTLITAINVGPLGDPKAYFFRGAVIALRQSDAKNILIKPHNTYDRTNERWDKLEQNSQH